MYVFEELQEIQKESAVDTIIRRPLAPAEGSNGSVSRRCSRTGEVSSRYKSPNPSTRRCPSPNLTRTVNPSSSSSSSPSSKRALSAERKRPSSRPTSPSCRPSTPVSDTSAAEQQLSSSKKIGSSRLPEVLWPSTMRSLSVSFQSDSISIPVSKKEKEKPVTHALSDRTLKPSSNVTTTPPRKSTPERKRSPLKGGNSSLVHKQSENSRPVDGVQARLIDQHRWPSRAGGGRLSSTLLTRSVDLSSDSFGKSSTSSPCSSSSLSNSGGRRLSSEGVSDCGGRIQSSPISSTGIPLRRVTVEGVSDSAGRFSSSSSLSSTGILSRRLSAEGVSDSGGRFSSSSSLSSTGIPSRRLSAEGVLDSVGRFSSSSSLSSTGIPSRRLSVDGIPRISQKSYVDSSGQHLVFDEDHRAVGLRLKSVDEVFITESKEDALNSSRRASLGALPARSRLVPGQRLPSPNRAPNSKGTPSPLRTRPSTPTQSRGASPSRVTPSSPTKQSTNTTSVLSFIADIKKGKKTSQLEDAHQLRLLHNRYLQWRFANARADAAMYFQRLTAEESLYNVWQTNLELWDSVITKRIEVQRMNLELKVNFVLMEQFSYLEDWDLLERDHSASLDGTIKDLEASTLRLPITGGAKADIDSLKAAVSSAIDVMHTTVSSIYSVLPKVEDMNNLVSELSALAGHEKASLNECDALLASTAAMQVREYSLRTQVIQSEHDLRNTRTPILWATSA